MADRDMQRWMDTLDIHIPTIMLPAPPERIYANIMSRAEAKLIEQAAHEAFRVRAHKAEKLREKAGYGGLDTDYGGMTKHDIERVRDELDNARYN